MYDTICQTRCIKLRNLDYSLISLGPGQKYSSIALYHLDYESKPSIVYY